jgi:uncharacterized protein YjbI with pentapeptide repeats
MNKSKLPAPEEDKILEMTYRLSKKYPWRSSEENRRRAIHILQREYPFGWLCSIWRWSDIQNKSGWDWLTAIAIIAIGLFLSQFNNTYQTKASNEIQKDSVVSEYVREMNQLSANPSFSSLSGNAGQSGRLRVSARALTLAALDRLRNEEDETHRNIILLFLRELGMLNNESSAPVLENANLFDCNLRGANLSRASLKGAILRKVDLQNAWLVEANLADTDLRDANLGKARLNAEDNFKGAILRSSRLNNANLSGADLTGADLTGADLTGADLRDVKWDASTKWPSLGHIKNARNIPISLKTRLGL